MPTRGSDDDGTNHKLKSYDGKDYSEIIEFPVELVDRDGVVRRYSYEESLAVYHRRIQSAPWRYGDENLIRAEIGHCTRRIDQIKRSHKERSRRGRPVASTDPRASIGQGYDVLRRHYRHALRERGLAVDGDLQLRLSLLDDSSDCRVYHVGFDTGRSEHLLTIYPFDRASDSDPRAAFMDARDRYRGLVVAPGIERLLLDEETDDAGYLLSGGSELPEGLLLAACSTVPAAPNPDDEAGADFDWLGPEGVAVGESQERPAFERGVEALQADRHGEALDLLRRAVQENPWHREAYLALLAALDVANLHSEAEMYGAMADHYLGADGLVQYRRGVNMVRQGRLDEAVQSFDAAGSLDGSLYQPGYFAAHLLLARGRDLDGAIERMSGAARVAPDEMQLPRLVRALERTRIARRLLFWGGLVLTFAALLWWSSGAGAAAWLVLLGLALSLAARPITAGVGRYLLQRRMARNPEAS